MTKIHKIYLTMQIAIVGATGGLGKEIVRQSLLRGYAVTAAIRDTAKAETLFEGKAVRIASVNLNSGAGLDEAFSGVNVVVEVISNDQRPSGVEKIVSACERANVKTFVACGGAGQLFQEDGSRVVTMLEKMPDMGWARPITDLHMRVQELSFASSIPMVLQIAPPGMNDGEASGTVKPCKDKPAGVFSTSYQDVAFCLLEALENPEFNRSMMGISPK